MVEIETGEEITCYIKYKETKAGNASVKHDGKFASLYRLTIGKDPIRCYSQAQHLVRHFVGHEFLVTYVITSSAKQGPYRKAKTVKPAHPIVTEHWTKTGRKCGYSRTKKTAKKRGKIFEISLIKKAVTPHFYLTLPHFSNGFKSLIIAGQEDLRAVAIPVEEVKSGISEVLDEKQQTKVVKKNEVYFKTTVTQRSEKERAFQFHQKPNETDGQYHQRVIDESWDVMQW